MQLRKDCNAAYCRALAFLSLTSARLHYTLQVFGSHYVLSNLKKQEAASSSCDQSLFPFLINEIVERNDLELFPVPAAF